MRNMTVRKSYNYTPAKRYRSSLVRGLTTEEAQRINESLSSQLDYLDEFLKHATPLPVDENGSVILDPNNPAHRDWMKG